MRTYFFLATFFFLQIAGSQSVPPDFTDALVKGGFTEPVGAAWDANGRAYVWEKRGMVWIVENGVTLPTPLIDLRHEVGNWRDHGFLGFALDPQFLSNGHIYLLYAVDRHHLMEDGTPGYDPNTNEYFAATIMRLTRYTAIAPQFNTVDPASRTVLLGENASAGPALLHESHSTGSVAFGTDGTLLVSIGDGASYASTDVGSASETYWEQAIADGIIRPEENVGALRSQMVNSFNGKILRLDPITGDGLPSNPWFDPTEPRAPRSRVWAMGLRNPYRFTVKPNSGSTDPAAGQPGTLFIGDVGWNLWEDLNVCTEGGMNFGWPLFEGFDPHTGYSAMAVQNRDAPNPLYNGVNCTQEYFTFQDLIKQATPVHLNAHPNPCDPLVQIPNSIPKHFHARPSIDWRHGNRSRCGSFNGNTAITFDLNDPQSPVAGPSFGGWAALGGPQMQAGNFPAEFQNSSFHADYVGGWIKRFVIDENGDPVSVHDFASGLGAVTWLGLGPDGCIHYIRYNTNELRRICYTLNVDMPPIALAGQDTDHGPGPLTVQFTGSGSSDPEGLPLDYLWDFGDGITSDQADPSHVFNAPPGVPTSFNVTLTVTDQGGQENSTILLVSVNNTPPQVSITSFADGAFYPVGVDTVFQYQADVIDAEHGPAQLSYAWRTVFHHNTHTHPEPIDTAPSTSAVISGVGCDGETYYYMVHLTVTDAHGLSTSVAHTLYPRCHAIAPTAIINSSVNAGELPLPVQFSGTGSYDPGTIVSYHWDFGDGTFSTDAEPAKIFTETGDHTVTLIVTDDDGLTGTATRTISAITLDPPQCVGALGSIRREVWNGIAGTAINALTGSVAFPDQPSGTNFPTSLQGPSNAGDNYGTRFRGYIIAPQTGNYIFTVTSDDASEVYLGLNAEPRHKRLICSVPGWTNSTEYTKYPSQVSAPIHLQAGAYYYVEVLHKEGTGGDHVTLRWQTPTNSTRTVVPGSALARWQDCAPSVRVRAMLQGPYKTATGMMNDDLREDGLVPLIEPHTALGMSQVGSGAEAIPPARLAITGKNAVVDWVLIELRDPIDPDVIIATKNAILERDGDIKDVSDQARLLFNVPPGEYHVTVRHRNHLAAMTAAPVVLGAQEMALDLTLASTPTFGTDARRTMPDGKMAMWAGDARGDGVLRYMGANNDRDLILQQIGGVILTNSYYGYHVSDINLDGVVRYSGAANDRDIILLNIGGIVPTAIRLEQVP